MPRFARLFAIPLAGVALLAAAACSSENSTPLAGTEADASPASATAAASIQPATTTTSFATTKEMSVADLVKLAEPSVVRIETTSGVGSGFVVSADGDIITNNHVVTSAAGRTLATVQVTLNDGAVKTGKVVGVDPRSDLALIKIDLSGLKPLKFGSLANTLVGQDVVAIGFALDLSGGEGASFSVTRGIVSAKNRGIEESSTILGAIQTDAAINHGNSGGPLLNLAGEVIGVNTAIKSDPTTGEVAPGIGFAVGVDTVKAVYSQLKENGKVNRGLLGITAFDALRPARAAELGIPAEGGVVLGDRSVQNGGPAATAGIKAGDVIVSIGGDRVRNEADLAVAMIDHHPGEVVDVEIYRDGKKLTVKVTLGTAPAA
ncbi:MAG: trypsin-like peptidase domain-containing protein [Chloroflexi bacterium]|nr:trypsin-like peptidase domain-containing protein [Chloroflexota bacterium]